MKTIIALALAMVLLLGCAQGGNGGTANNATGAIIKNTTAAYAPGGAPSPAPTENTTGVMMADYRFPERPPVPQFDFSNVTTSNGTLIVYYFHSSRCSACNALQPEIDALRAKYPEVLWLDYDITTQNGRYAYDAFAAQRNLSLKEQLVPQALVDGKVITDRFSINATLEGVIKNSTAR